MTAEQFINSRRPQWERLQQTVDQMVRRRAAGVSADELYDMLMLYRQASSDLARLRTLDAPQLWTTYLNRLVARAHGVIYSRRQRRPMRITDFFMQTVPRTFRENWRFTMASLLLCAAIYAMAYQTVQDHPHVVIDIMGGMQDEVLGEKTAGDIQDRFADAKASLGSPAFSSIIAANNIRVAMLAFALGITFGLGTVYVLIINSVMLGGIAGAFAQSGLESVLWATILPHGLLELSAIVVSGAAGLMIGWSLWCPGQRTRARALREQAGQATCLVVGLLPAFLIAAAIEGFVTPANWPAAVKLAVGIVAFVVFWAHLLLAGRHDSGATAASSA